MFLTSIFIKFLIFYTYNCDIVIKDLIKITYTGFLSLITKFLLNV